MDLSKQVYSIFFLHILYENSLIFCYILYILRYHHVLFVSTEAATSLLSSTYSTQNARVIMIVCIYDVYSSQKDLSKVGKCISHKKADLTMLIMMYISTHMN